MTDSHHFSRELRRRLIDPAKHRVLVSRLAQHPPATLRDTPIQQIRFA
ncbi:hypothetical protein [Halomonas sp. DQ26W]|nr:hypothetical protein [Halomonas sp. DQ26W]